MQGAVGGQRAVIVFFRSLSEINDFLEKQYNSYFLTRRNDEIGKINVMSEESGSINEIIVSKATTQG